MSGQVREIEFDLQEHNPSYKISNLKPVQLTIKSPAIDNLVRQYDANPFETPVIVTRNQIQQSISGALTQYLSNIGLQTVQESENQINLKVVLCAINYLSGKGWTATVKLDLEVTSNNREILSQSVGGYKEEGGKEKEFNYAETAINNALYEAFEGVNWESIATRFTNSHTALSQNDNVISPQFTSPETNKRPGLNNNSIHINWQSPNNENNITSSKVYNVIACVSSSEQIDDITLAVNGKIQGKEIISELQFRNDCENGINKSIDLTEGENTIEIQVKTPSGIFFEEKKIIYQTFGEYYALLIAIEDYSNISKLDQPIDDANRLQEVLTSSYNFKPENIFFLKNPTRTEIIDMLDELVTVVKQSDNLLVFYAGHGYWDEERETGYWLPVNATRTSTANWLRNSTIQEYIGDIKSKHTLLIADACFGGGIFKTRKAFHDAPTAINQIYELMSRKAITSGMLNEVPDKSVFFDYFIRRLEQNDQKYISSLQLFSSFRIAVMNNSENVPQYGTIQKTGDEGGDFIFIRTR